MRGVGVIIPTLPRPPHPHPAILIPTPPPSSPPPHPALLILPCPPAPSLAGWVLLGTMGALILTSLLPFVRRHLFNLWHAIHIVLVSKGGRREGGWWGYHHFNLPTRTQCKHFGTGWFAPGSQPPAEVRP